MISRAGILEKMRTRRSWERVIVALPALLVSSNSMFEAQKVVIFDSAAVLSFRKNTKPPVKPLGSLLALLIALPELIVAVPALLVPRKAMGPVLKAFKIAGPAVLEFVNSSTGRSTLNVGALAGSATMPAPVIATATELPELGVSPNVKPGALNDRVSIVVGTSSVPCESVIDVGVDGLNGYSEFQLPGVFQSEVVPTQVAS